MLAPLLGLVLGWLLMSGLYVMVARWTPARVNRVFRRLQLVSAALYSLGHGSNDAQKTMGIIAGVLVTGGYLDDLRHPALGDPRRARRDRAGHAVGRLAHRPHHGAAGSRGCSRWAVSRPRPAAPSPSSSPASWAIPVSTTHTITGAIVGVGATRRLSAVRWGVAGRIVWAWVLTIPCSAAIAAITFLLVRGLIP